jgi:hypothetical protein
MEFKKGDKVLFLGENIPKEKHVLIDGQECIINLTYLTIGKEYFIRSVNWDGDRITYYITADNDEIYGYWTFETGGFYMFGTLKEWRKRKLKKINSI